MNQGIYKLERQKQTLLQGLTQHTSLKNCKLFNTTATKCLGFEVSFLANKTAVSHGRS